MNAIGNSRILLIDDTPAIHEDFRKILGRKAPGTVLDDIEAALFGAVPEPVANDCELDSAYQGEEGLAMVRSALDGGRPYALAFVDMRMPPGWDGVETIERLWQVDPALQIVICTAYADYSWDEVLRRLDVGDRLLILKKPFDAIEVRQLASAMRVKWQMSRQVARRMADLQAAVEASTTELRLSNQSLQAEISERRRLESQLVQSEKLVAVGQLAAGIAHEINNPVGFVLSNLGALADYHQTLFAMLAAYAEAKPASAEAAIRLERLAETLGLPLCLDDIPQLMRETREGVVRVQRIVRDLKDFSRVDQSGDWQLADLQQGIESTLGIVAGEIGGKADLVKDYASLPEIECLPSELNQVAMSLLRNAAQAISNERGRITIGTGCDGEHVWMEIGDDGAGIAEENLPRIFDPFFTTRPVGQGSGLGLSVAYGIVRKHGGRIEVQTAIGKGSVFRVVLPLRRPTQGAPAISTSQGELP